MARIPYLSATQIGMFLKCPRQWAYRYVEGRKIPPSGAMKQSGVFHQTAEKNYRQKVESTQDLNEDDLTDFYVDTFDQEFQREEVVLDEGETLGALKDQGVQIVKEHRRIIAPKVQPVTVEEKIELTLGKEDKQHKLVAIIDVMDTDGMIRDNKAIARTPNQDDIDKDIQLSTYSLAKRLQTGKVESGLALDIVVKNKVPKAVTLKTERTREALRLHLNRMGMIARAINAEAFPTNPTGWWCSPRFCGFWGICMGRSMKTVDMGEHLQKDLEDSIADVQRKRPTTEEA